MSQTASAALDLATGKPQRTVHGVRAQAQRYLQALGVPFRLETHKTGTAGARGYFVQGGGMQFKCGCWIPTGYPLWRQINGCDQHVRALEPRR